MSTDDAALNARLQTALRYMLDQMPAELRSDTLALIERDPDSLGIRIHPTPDGRTLRCRWAGLDIGAINRAWLLTGVSDDVDEG